MQRKDQIALGLAAAVAALLLLSRQRPAGSGTPGVVPGPGPAPGSQESLETARRLIQTVKTQAAGASPARRETLAQTLERAADGFTGAGQTQSAEECRAAAADIRRGAAQSTTPSLFEEFDALRRKAEEYLRGVGSIDEPTLAAMDRVADQLAHANPPMPATSAALVALANASYARSGYKRSITMSL